MGEGGRWGMGDGRWTTGGRWAMGDGRWTTGERRWAVALGSRSDVQSEVPNRNREIERKYLLRGLPPQTSGATALHIDQGYLPGERINERVRRTRFDGTV